MEETRTTEKEQGRLPLPQVRIENKGSVTRVYVDGNELNGIRSINFLHDREMSDIPVLRMELLAEKVSIDTAQVFELPEVYHPFYVSSDQLVRLGILTYDQLNDLLEKKLL